MLPTIRFVLLTALRDRLFVSLLALLALVFGVSIFLGSSAIVEARQATVVYAAAGARVLIALGLTVFVAFHLEKLFENREIETLLSRAIRREDFVLSYWIAMALIVLLILAPTAGLIFVFKLSTGGAFSWLATVGLEGLIVVAFVMFCGMTMERAIPTIFATAGFYVLARLVGFFTGIAQAGSQTGVNQVTNPMIEGIGYLVPRLDLAGQTHWLVYGDPEPRIVILVAVQAVIYIALLLGACMFDLRRKHF